MSNAKIDVRYTTVLKDYPSNEADRYELEIFAYTELSFATPELKWHNPNWLEMERLTPILDLGPDRSRKYRQPLRELLQEVHDAGWWHGDVALCNVVVHPSRGPLLIDWENIRPASTNISYDLYGAAASGATPPWASKKAPDGVSWNGPWYFCPGPYWS